MHDLSVLGVLAVVGLAVLGSAAAAVVSSGIVKDYRCRRRRARLRVIAGNRGAARPRRVQRADRAEAQLRAAGARTEEVWDSLPVTQWQPPRERGSGPESPPAA
jgi:hypothetical protein